jgi:thioesterase domain-containing protein/acyl carrier protein
LLLRSLPSAPAIDLAALEARLGAPVEQVREGEQALRVAQEAHLCFGPRWEVLRSVRRAEGEALAELELPRSFAKELGTFGLHPALLDIATGYAMELIDGYDAEHGLWVPVRYGRVEVQAPLTRELRAWARLAQSSRADSEFASFDVVLTDGTGNVLVRVSDFTIKRLDQRPDFAHQPPPDAAALERDARETRTASEAEQQLAERLELGIRPQEGAEAFTRLLAEHRSARVVVSSIELSALEADAERSALAAAPSAGTRFARPDHLSAYVEPADEIERTLAGFFEELLGVQPVGAEDSFFDLGGHSLIAVRLFARIKKSYAVDYPMSVLFEAPTVRACAALIRDSVGAQDEVSSESRRPARRFTHLVPMHFSSTGASAAERRPFFLVAGMFGNVLNLRHLANLVGADRPFYGVQARGLYGEMEPHATFEEAARDYLAELRSVQPEGPYLLGGFSGGGIAALEMARQLREAGEEIAALVLLDTPLPYRDPISGRDKLDIHLQRIRARGLGYFVDWAKQRIAWELEQRAKRSGPGEVADHHFHNEAIERAFRSALARYELTRIDGTIHLFRPKLPVVYRLSGGRMANQWREIVFEDNGWSRYCSDVRVFEVPGDHDSMVLEPNVRVLAAKLREVIEASERAAPEPASPRVMSARAIGA